MTTFSPPVSIDTSVKVNHAVSDGVRDKPTDAEHAFEHFVTRSGQDLLRTAVLLTGVRHIAEDLVQDTLAQVFRSWARVSNADNPGAYARAILVRQFLASARRRRLITLGFSESFRDVAASERDREGDIVLRQAIRGLSPRLRAVVVFRYYHDLTEARTAQELGISIGAVKRYHARALAYLRAALTETKE